MSKRTRFDQLLKAVELANHVSSLIGQASDQRSQPKSIRLQGTKAYKTYDLAVRSVSAVRIRLTEERWRHIVLRHPELEPCRHLVLTLNTGEDFLSSAVIDQSNGFAYFGTYTAPGIVVKVRLSDFTRIDSLVLNPDEQRLAAAVIDMVNGFAYFGTYAYSYPSKIVKIDIKPQVRSTVSTYTIMTVALGSIVLIIVTWSLSGRIKRGKGKDFQSHQSWDVETSDYYPTFFLRL